MTKCFVGADAAKAIRPAAAALMAAMMIACGGNETGSPTKIEMVDGIRHVFNSDVPEKGKIRLRPAEILRIDSSRVDPEDPPLFEKAAKDDQGDVYLADTHNVKVFRFDPRGKLVAMFLAKGQGPGEFPRFGDIQFFNGHIWIIGNWPMKIARFTRDGRFIEEWNFRSFRNFYLRTRVIGPDRFLTVCYQGDGDDQERVRVSALVNAKEELLARYFEDKNAGIYRIPTGPDEGPALATTDPLVAADIHHAYDYESGMIYVCANREYAIHKKNKEGRTLMVIHGVHDPIIPNEKQKEDFLRSVAPRLPPEAMAQAMARLPKTWNAISGIASLRRGHLAVTRFTGPESVEVDIFDRDGRFVYTILPSTEIPDLRKVFWFKDGLGAIAELGGNMAFVEFRIENLPKIFD